MTGAPLESALRVALPDAPRQHSHARHSLIQNALGLGDDASSAGAIGFYARALVQATLPHCDPKTNEFVRRNGNYALSILAPADVGLPYGRYPRLVIAYLTTEAVRKRERCIPLGRRFSHFCGELGLTPTSGPRGSLVQLREQMQRLFSCSFQCIFHSERSGQHAGDGFLLAEKRLFGWEPGSGARPTARDSYVKLSERFYREATGAPVPLDLRVLKALRSPFEIDIYVGLTWRFFSLRRRSVIPWESLMLQFGSRYRNPRHFKQRFLRYLRRVIDYYPETRLAESPQGLVLRPSPTHIPVRSNLS
ncbi:MAG: pirin [bacterium]|nr:pirin [bacterium]